MFRPMLPPQQCVVFWFPFTPPVMLRAAKGQLRSRSATWLLKPLDAAETPNLKGAGLEMSDVEQCPQVWGPALVTVLGI